MTGRRHKSNLPREILLVPPWSQLGGRAETPLEQSASKEILLVLLRGSWEGEAVGTRTISPRRFFLCCYEGPKREGDKRYQEGERQNFVPTTWFIKKSSLPCSNDYVKLFCYSRRVIHTYICNLLDTRHRDIN